MRNLLVFFFVVFSMSAQAAMIHYSGGRPIEFHGIVVDSALYDVSVTWGDSYDNVYGGGTPWFLNDTDGAIAAATALRAALIADGFTSITAESYLMVPKWIQIQTVASQAVYLHDETLDVAQVQAFSYAAADKLGYTTWLAIPEPATIWLFGSALGLLGWLKRRTA
jgi:hypothetical protein